MKWSHLIQNTEYARNCANLIGIKGNHTKKMTHLKQHFLKIFNYKKYLIFIYFPDDSDCDGKRKDSSCFLCSTDLCNSAPHVNPIAFLIAAPMIIIAKILL